MRISELIDKLGKILNDFGNLEAYTTSGTWGDQEVESVAVKPAPKFPPVEQPDLPRVIIS